MSRENVPTFPLKGRAQRRRQTRTLLVLALLTPPLAVSAQEAPATTLPDTAASGTRPELLQMLQQVDSQLKEATAQGNQENVDRLLALKAQFEVLLLQAELESLRRENAGMREQQADTAMPAPAGAGSAEVETEISGMQDEFTALDQQQANVLDQLNAIADQHAILLKQLGSAPPEAEASPAPAAAADSEAAAQLQQELAALQQRFEKLSAQQGTVNTELQSITDQHADLLDKLGSAPAAAAPRTYTVAEGDSLSSIAKEYYASANGWPAILQANPFVTDPNTLYVGTVLTIP